MWHVLGTKLKLIAVALMAASFIYLDYRGINLRNTGSWGYASMVVTAMVTILVWMGKSKPWWRFFWSSPYFWQPARRYLNQNLCPDLNGKWEGAIRSNFALDKPGGELGSPIPCTVKIEADWFNIKIWMKTESLDSFTKLVVIEKDSDEDAFVLSYIYEAKLHNPSPGDDRSHWGAGKIKVEWEEDEPTLRGHYWTDRCWHGCTDSADPTKVVKNTAGQIELSRISR